VQALLGPGAKLGQNRRSKAGREKSQWLYLKKIDFGSDKKMANNMLKKA